MKSGKRPTGRQRKAMEWAGIRDTKEWLVVKSLQGELLIVHRMTGQTKEVPNE
ncbi:MULTISPECIES: DUF6906 family protein [unclassified Bacillus (in: firmicutes)]|uniref:DUF6906 family protein n=1 Tax=unclassified Bacillus (in: firmicutes) TaxID=185979 RepID=UPI001BE62B53|nr:MULTISPECIES: hypothetical protein [unclassified Bacillus (in: firmicutes)]MBT2615099.1 hypothetical protein [Bacillus sp. ISL-78]MBT2627716.1 hypothetical protein [Bacillus sp. ISL-101]